MIQHFQVTYTNKLDKNIQFVQTGAGTVENTRKNICIKRNLPLSGIPKIVNKD